MAVVSATFESSLGLSAYVLFSYYLELQNAAICKLMDRELASPVAHGLGTYQWLKEDVTTDQLRIYHNSCRGFMEASTVNASELLQKFRINHSIICRTSSKEQVLRYQLTVKLNNFPSSIKVQEIGRIHVS